MQRLFCFLLLLLFLMTPALAEETAPAVLESEIELEDFVVTVGSDWVIENADSENDAILASAVTIDNRERLTFFFSGDGDEDKVAETAAVNEYSSGIRREPGEEINGVKIIYAVGEDTNTVYAYFSANAHMYTVSITSNAEDATIDELSETLHGIMQSLTVRKPE